MNLLLTSGANVNLQNQVGYSSLIQSVIKNNREIVQILLAADASLDLTDLNGKSALIWSAMRGYDSITD